MWRLLSLIGAGVVSLVWELVGMGLGVLRRIGCSCWRVGGLGWRSWGWVFILSCATEKECVFGSVPNAGIRMDQ